MTLKQGIPKIDDIMLALNTDSYKLMEKYSKNYLDKNIRYLMNYPWIKDALNQWSRIYEYPFCYQELNKYLSKEAKVLDAGSGITFFPFFLNSIFNVTCLDQDDYSKNYHTINFVQQTNVKFIHSKLHTMSIQDESYEAIYCISVLEHTNRYEDILKEFCRVLRPEGILIVTFDIDINGRRMGIDLPSVKNLIKVISTYFEIKINADNISDELLDKDLYATNYVRTWNHSLLPWPQKSFFRLVKNTFNLRKTKVSNLTFCVVTAIKL